MSLTATWMDLEIILLSKIEKDKSHITYIWNLIKMKQMNLFTKQKQTHRSQNQINSYQRGNMGGSDKLGDWDWHTHTTIYKVGAPQVALVVKNLPASTGDLREADSIPGWGRASGKGHGNPLQYSCLENPMDRGGWWATVHSVAESQTWLKRLSMAHI